jgi:hypothetical protein
MGFLMCLGQNPQICSVGKGDHHPGGLFLEDDQGCLHARRLGTVLSRVWEGKWQVVEARLEL